MARRRRDKSPSGIKLQQPDRTGPSEQTLLDLAEQRGLFNKVQEREESIKAEPAATETSAKDPEPLPPIVERLFETLLWTVSLSTLHFTLDVLVQNQYAAEISWPKIIARTGQAFLGMLRLFPLPRCDYGRLEHRAQLTITAPFSVRPPVLHAACPCLEPDHPSRPASPLPTNPPTEHILRD